MTIRTQLFSLGGKVRSAAAICAAGAILSGSSPACLGMTAILGGALPQPLPLFPDDNWWNLDISGWPVDPGSAAYINFINNGGTRHLHPDLGGNAPTTQHPYASYGMPYAVVSGVAGGDLQAVQFNYASESDGVDHNTGASFPFYPIPPEAKTQPYWVEGGDPAAVDLRSSQDRHMLIIDAERNYLYELYNVFFSTSQNRWYAGSGAFFDMNTNDRRPDGWTSADAAGLAILPGLIRHDEVYDLAIPEIRHAFRVTVRATDGFVYPASHRAGSTAGALPMGARLRLKTTVDVTQRTANPNMQKIFRAMQRYGLIVADNGSDMYVTGTYDTRWDNDVVNPAFYSLTASDFEVIKLGYNPSTGPAQLNGLTISTGTVTGGQNVTGAVTLTGPAEAGGVTVALASTASAVLVPASVLVPAGATAAAFNISTAPVAIPTEGTITASQGTLQRQATLRVNPPVPASLSLNPTTVNPGSSSIATVTLTGAAAASGAVVSVASSKPSVAAAPASVTVAAGKTTATFVVTTASGAGNTSATITVSSGGVSRSAVLSVRKKKR